MRHRQAPARGADTSPVLCTHDGTDSLLLDIPLYRADGPEERAAPRVRRRLLQRHHRVALLGHPDGRPHLLGPPGGPSWPEARSSV